LKNQQVGTKRDAFVRYIHAISRAIDWAYSGDATIGAYVALQNHIVYAPQK
jgi:hypothetical protein